MCKPACLGHSQLVQIGSWGCKQHLKLTSEAPRCSYRHSACVQGTTQVLLGAPSWLLQAWPLGRPCQVRPMPQTMRKVGFPIIRHFVPQSKTLEYLSEAAHLVYIQLLFTHHTLFPIGHSFHWSVSYWHPPFPLPTGPYGQARTVQVLPGNPGPHLLLCQLPSIPEPQIYPSWSPNHKKKPSASWLEHIWLPILNSLWSIITKNIPSLWRFYTESQWMVPDAMAEMLC